MPVPKKRMSRARKMRRRANHDKLTRPMLSVCPKCSAFKLPHRICGSCGYYKNRQVIDLAPPELDDF
ncbi:MAG: 50S ribosomal protein L32 [Myxococcota bacterium]|nr:50S ribosomal protein L32 [Myxococcota bacterium]